MRYYIASVSWGKDSLALVLRLIEENKPLNEVISYNNGAEFQAIYDIRDKVIPLLESKGIKYTELKPKRDFFYDMLERPVESKQNGCHKGWGWCGGACRWGTKEKTRAIDEYKATLGYDDIVDYIGIAADEPDRIKDKTYPLVEWGMTEADCLQYCYDRGYFWEEDGIRLYDILDRVSCWCCSNKNLKELRNIYLYMPQYWEKLKDLQSKIDKPLKRYKNKKYGSYGNVFELEKVFDNEERERVQITIFDKIYAP